MRLIPILCQNVPFPFLIKARPTSDLPTRDYTKRDGDLINETRLCKYMMTIPGDVYIKKNVVTFFSIHFNLLFMFREGRIVKNLF